MATHPLTLLIAFDQQAQRDRRQDAAFLQRRDRRLALDAEARGQQLDPAGWLTALQPHQAQGHAQQQPAELQRWQLINRGFMLAGALSGSIAMAGLLAWEGQERINLTLLLALVLLQLLLGLITCLQGLLGWQPWRWLRQRLQPTQTGHSLDSLGPQLMTRAAQGGGLAFSLSALGSLLVMVVVQDLAFGWSTTLNTAASSYHQLLQTLALPWQALWPAASPSLELVEATRFYRSQALASTTDPARWGQWWPFVAMLWLTWAVLPRLFFWLFSQWHLRYRARKQLQQHPALSALYQRMHTPWIEHGNRHNDSADLPDTRTELQLHPLPSSGLLLSWSGAGQQERPSGLPAVDRLPSAGGAASLAEDRQLIEQLGHSLRQQAQPGLILLVNAWEAPTGDLADFLQQARQQWPQPTRIYLLPLAQQAQQAPGSALLGQWSRFVQRQHDPLLSLTAVEP